MAELPGRFLETMQRLLGEEYESFLHGLDGRRQFGLRVNTAKITLEEFARIAPFPLKKIPWISNGYFYREEDAPASHPFYAAGLYYLQEPSAMTPASRLPVEPGEKVLDLCAAPGGKATALGAALRGEGLLVVNDINNARAKALLRNVELFGITNAFVTNEPPYVLAEKYPAYFDKIMVDAPCSGEGMFRKNPAAVEAWQEKGPEHFSRLQKEIILHGADMLRPGGMMLYSTCTFSPMENEAVVSHLLECRPEMELIPMEDYEGFSSGLTAFDGEKFREECRLCRRIWPHRMPGEGHFMALFRKKEEGVFSGEPVSENRGYHRAGGQENAAGVAGVSGKKKGRKKGGDRKAGAKTDRWWERCQGFSREQKQAMGEFFCHVNKEFAPEQIDVRGEKVYYVPSQIRDNQGLHFLRNGVYLGDLKKKRFEPSQPFALTLSKETYDQCINLAEDDEKLGRYLRGESFSAEELEEKGCGWYLMTVEGYALGFGKLSKVMYKNKYPTGWRKNN